MVKNPIYQVVLWCDNAIYIHTSIMHTNNVIYLSRVHVDKLRLCMYPLGAKTWEQSMEQWASIWEKVYSTDMIVSASGRMDMLKQYEN
jgi:hypothetical protein